MFSAGTGYVTGGGGGVCMHMCMCVHLQHEQRERIIITNMPENTLYKFS